MLERIDLDRVSAEAHRIDVGRALLTLLVGAFWLLGWTVAKVVIGVVAVITFSVAAVRVGWQDAHRSSRVGRGVGPA